MWLVIDFFLNSNYSSLATTPLTTSRPSILTSGQMVDVGQPHPSCSSKDLGCVFNGKLMGCYDAQKATCFPGGNICSKPFLACYDHSNPQTTLICFSPLLYSCSNGALGPVFG